MALDLPGSAREALAGWRDALIAGRDELRPVAAEALHVTLVFIGHRPEDEVPAITAAVGGALGAVEGPAELAPAGVVGVLARRPRLFALDLHDPGGGAARLQATVAGALAGGGFHEPERRPFWPHVTLARVKHGASAGSLPPGVPGAVAPFSAATVTLYRSRLSPRGARYEALARFGLVG